jgi:hypothetical protein
VRRAVTGRETERECCLLVLNSVTSAPQHSAYVVLTWLQWPRRWRRADADRCTAPQHQLTTLASLYLYYNGLGEGRGRSLADALRLNTTLVSINPSNNDLREGGGLSLAETLRLNTPLTSIYLGGNRALGAAQSQAHRMRGFDSHCCVIPLKHSDILCLASIVQEGSRRVGTKSKK